LVGTRSEWVERRTWTERRKWEVEDQSFRSGSGSIDGESGSMQCCALTGICRDHSCEGEGRILREGGIESQHGPLRCA
jgi:hypothetical protein